MMMTSGKETAPQKKFDWYEEMTHSDKEPPQYQLNPLTKRQEEMMHPNHLRLLRKLIHK